MTTLDPHYKLNCDLYRRQLLQCGASEEWANTQAAILAQCYESKQRAERSHIDYKARLQRARELAKMERQWARRAIALTAVGCLVIGAAIGLAVGVVL